MPSRAPDPKKSLSPGRLLGVLFCAMGAGIQMTKSALSGPRQVLLKIMQGINFGRIEQLNIRRGEPVLTPPPRLVREVKFAAENGPRAELAKTDFALKSQAVEFFRSLDDIGDGCIEVLEIKHGLPFRMDVAESAV